jgi:poly-beta-1,6-N-acetyl-D-glucosamine N-deacetylase
MLTLEPSTPERQAEPPSPKRYPWWQQPRVLVMFLALAALLYVIAPTAMQVGLEHNRTAMSTPPVKQEDTAVGSLDPAVLANASAVIEAWKAVGERPVIISYHDISPLASRELSYTVTPAAFSQQMAVLESLGAHAMSAAEFRAYTEGTPPPPRSVLITFDDGARGVYRYADRILAQYNFRATAFIISGFVGTRAPYYITWKEIDQLSKSGRWDFEAHTHVGHTRIPIDRAGTSASFVSNLAWIPSQERVETIEEHRIRLEGDLDRNLTELQDRGYAKGSLFAFPFSDYGAPSNHPTIREVLLEVTSARFSSVFADDVKPHAIGGPFQFNRLSLDHDGTADTFMTDLGRVFELTAKAPADLAPTGFTTTAKTP